MGIFGEKYAQIYSELYKDKNYGEEIDFLSKWFDFPLSQKSVVFDIGCGTGGHSIELLKRNLRVIGVDPSEEMLEIAKKRISSNNFEAKSSAAENIDFNSDVTACFLLFHVSAYLGDSLAIVLRNFWEGTRPGSLIFIDFWNQSYIDEVGLADTTKNISFVDSKGSTQNWKRVTNSRIDGNGKDIEVTISLEDLDNQESVTEVHKLRAWSPSAAKRLFEEQGFKVQDFSSFPYDLDSDGEKSRSFLLVGVKER